MRKIVSMALIVGMAAIPAISYAGDKAGESQEITEETGQETEEADVQEDALMDDVEIAEEFVESEIVEDDPCAKAKADAVVDTNELLWMGSGCLTSLILGPLIGLIPVGIGYFSEPEPKEMNLLGKSPEYVAAYTDCYGERASLVQGNNAAVGCLAGSAALLTASLVVLFIYTLSM